MILLLRYLKYVITVKLSLNIMMTQVEIEERLKTPDFPTKIEIAWCVSVVSDVTK